jgi:hypothetical protein
MTIPTCNIARVHGHTSGTRTSDMPVSSRKVCESKPMDCVFLVLVNTMRSFPRYIDELFRPFPVQQQPQTEPEDGMRIIDCDSRASEQKTASTWHSGFTCPANHPAGDIELSRCQSGLQAYNTARSLELQLKRNSLVGAVVRFDVVAKSKSQLQTTEDQGHCCGASQQQRGS